MFRKLLTLTMFLFAFAAMAQTPVDIEHFGDRDGRVLADFNHPSKAGHLYYTASVVRTAGERELFLISDVQDGSEIQIVALDTEGNMRRFMTFVANESESLIDLSSLGYEMESLFFRSRQPFTAAIGEGELFEAINVKENTLGRDLVTAPAMNAEEVKGKASCSTTDTFNTLTCTSSDTCGDMVVDDYTGTLTRCVRFSTNPMNPDIKLDHILRWNCHYGAAYDSGPSGTIHTTSSCGCKGEGYWDYSAGNVYHAESRCPGMTDWFEWTVE